ncbi:pyridoxal 5'-phosphate synthase glutaminase subunit PdxT [Desulfoscipio gibsoniae]|uniref:Pyridoxal 5'-phosphate synthase subunit PdxT n=1 Tax=Desulfoscipio gibsoniae DSM 7213 TaxID=767817 RepID=R4KAQ0_9FIRM|nr:pyridoxal 5'-phosphate synthase glutaminase subunit PdxT [Desulfoscipio gibsoniae]AGK99638.1 pyridoxal 5''-phosphate synthase, glutaminase subunit Pdx2 [Desulfoscipio gibsoniae DSM 7213]
MLIGVLALQGAFREHQYSLEKCGVSIRQVRKPPELEGIEALVIPGGESTTMGKLLNSFSLMEPIINLAKQGMPILGTCAGLIMLAKCIRNSRQETLALMDIKVERNAFGRQVDSFETDLDIPVLGAEPFRAVFIRAPYIAEVSEGVDILARCDDKIVCARQGRFLVAAFHPELTDDLRMHRYFIENVVK